MDDYQNILHCIGLGIVAENKPVDTHKVKVFPVELLSGWDGQINELSVPHTVANTLNNQSIEVNVGTSLMAEWLKETNRASSPDVRRGEQVLLYQQADSEYYYWASLGRDDHLRRLETVIYRWSGLPDNANEPINADNSYFLEVSTHKRIVTFKTSARNGELVQYMVQANPGMGQLTIQDDYGNLVQMDSARGIMHLRNEAGTLVELNKKRIHLQADWSISLKSERIQLECDDLRVEADDVEFQTRRFHVSGTFSAGSINTSDLEVGEAQIGKMNKPSPGASPSADAVPSDITTHVDYPFEEDN